MAVFFAAILLALTACHALDYGGDEGGSGGGTVTALKYQPSANHYVDFVEGVLNIWSNVTGGNNVWALYYLAPRSSPVETAFEYGSDVFNINTTGLQWSGTRTLTVGGHNGAAYFIMTGAVTTTPATVRLGTNLSVIERITAGTDFVNITDTAGNLSPTSKTEAELKALAPTAAGLLYYCSNCSVDGMVVSTGTTAGAFARISARTTAID